MNRTEKKKAVISHFNRIAAPDAYFANDWITTKAKDNEHKVVSDFLTGEGSSAKRALDAGCGVGSYSDILLEKGFTLVGFDISENMIKVCRSKYAERDSIALMLADIEYLPFQHSSFDMVLCIDMLVYVSEVSRKFVLQNLANLLKTGGVIIVEVKNKACPAYWFNRFRKDRLGGLYSIDGVTSALRSSGMKVEAVRGVFKPAFLSPIVVVKARKTGEG